MDLNQLRCFVAASEELHFGRAARRVEMLPSALGRFIRLLEEDLGTRLMMRPTRSVTLTDDGAAFLKEARALLTQTDALAAKFRTRGRNQAATVRVGAIDSAAAGLLPMLLHDFREQRPDVTVQLVEDKTIRLLPRLLSGRIDLAFIRPPESPDKRLEFMFLFHETAVVAVSDHHPFASKKRVTIADLADQPLIVPERDWDRWLDPDAAADLEFLAAPPDVRGIEMREISTLVNNVRNNGPELLEPAEQQAEQARLL